VLETMARSADLPRRRAAIEALGNLRDPALEVLLIETLEAGDDGLAAAAAWALAKLGRPSALGPLVRAARRGSFATPINASAAIAILAGSADRDRIAHLLGHRRRFVRLNGIRAATRVHGRTLATLATDDSSWLVRRAAVRALARPGAGRP